MTFASFVCCVWPCRRFRDNLHYVREAEWTVFVQARERTILRTFAYFTIFVVVCFMTFVNLIFCVKFSTAQKTAWLIAIFTGLVAGTARCRAVVVRATCMARFYPRSHVLLVGRGGVLPARQMCLP